MLTSKQRAYLRGLANGMDAIIQIGKTGVTPEIANAVDEALAARELVKLGVLNNCDVSSAEAAEMLAGRTRSEVVQVIGKKIVLYRKAKEKKGSVIELPK